MAIAKDTREFQAMTVAEADNVFMLLAKLTAELKRKSAAAEKRKAEIDLALAADTAGEQRQYDDLYSRLTEYILAHPERFVRPCKHQVKGIGTYGLETAGDKCKIVDPEAIIAFAKEQDIALYQTAVVIEAAAVKQHFRDGGTVPGAKYTPAGKVPKINVADSYIEQLLKG